MDDTSRRKRRRSIRNLRRQSVILGIGSDDPIALESENILNTFTKENHEEDYGSMWVDGELCIPFTKHKTRHASRTEHGFTIKDETENLSNNFENKVSISGPDWSPVELPRSPSANLSPKVMTPCNLFTDMESLEASVTMREPCTDVVQHSNNSLDIAFFDDSFGISPNDNIVQPTTMHPSPKEISQLEEMRILSQTSKCFSSPLFFHQSMMTNTCCNIKTPSYESSNGIPGSDSSQFVFDSNAINSSFKEPTNKEIYYTGLMIEQSVPYQDGQNITDKVDTSIEDFRIPHDLSGYVFQHQDVVAHTPQHVFKGQNIVRNLLEQSGYVFQHQDVVVHTPQHVFEGQNIERNLPEQLGYSGENRAKISSNIKYQCQKDVDQTHYYVEAPLSGVTENTEQSCSSFVNMEVRGRRILKDRNKLNSVGSDECDSDNEIFYTPKAAKTPSRLNAKRLASGAVHFIRNVATKLSKEKKNRRKTIFLFQNNCAPLVESPKQLSSSLPVESVVSTLTYCTHSGKENNCPMNEMVCGSFNTTDAKPVFDKTSNLSINCTISSNSNDIEGSDAIPVLKPISDSLQSTEMVKLGTDADKTTDVDVNVQIEEPFHSPCTVTNEYDSSNDIETLPSVSKTTEMNFVTHPQEHLFSKSAAADSNDYDHLELLKLPQSSNVGRRLRSADFSLVSEYDKTVNHMTETVSSSNTCRRSRRRSYEICRQKISMKSNSEATNLMETNTADTDPQATQRLSNDKTMNHTIENVSYWRSRRRSYEMCRQKISMKSNSEATDFMETNTADTDPQATQRLSNDVDIKPKRVTRYRKKNKQNLEDLYRNKNYKMPTKKTWETIYEVPHNEMLVGRKKLNRMIIFESVPPAKQRQRLKKAANLGWDVTGRKRAKIADDYVKNTINAIALDLASID